MTTTITTEANLTADPELRFTKTTGQAVATHPPRRVVAAQEHGRRVPGHPGGVLRGHPVGALAENAADSLRKGDRVLVHGTSTTRNGPTAKARPGSSTCCRSPARRQPALRHRHPHPHHPRRTASPSSRRPRSADP